jgi:hypothetical protein
MSPKDLTANHAVDPRLARALSNPRDDVVPHQEIYGSPGPRSSKHSASRETFRASSEPIPRGRERRGTPLPPSWSRQLILIGVELSSLSAGSASRFPRMLASARNVIFPIA